MKCREHFRHPGFDMETTLEASVTAELDEFCSVVTPEMWPRLSRL
jgi:hypothetical protein